MNLEQTKLVGLTMELDLKTREYKKLCNKLEKLKENNIDVNNPILIDLKAMFQRNHEEIVEINRQIKKLKINEEIKEKRLLEPFDSSNLFKKKNKIATNINNEEKNIIIVKNNNIFMRILDKIKTILDKN